ncbi:MAG: YdiU family protein [Rhodobacteraceae bacterium]|nr:YdiU family protein [Paracoccaceae bacterium]
MPIHFDNSFAKLPPQFFSPQLPTKVAAPSMIKFNASLATEMGIGSDDLTANMLAGNNIPDGATPIATAYSGHQFGGFSPHLGDGRAILLGEVISPNGSRHDLQLKGSGKTMFSRNGDGRANIGAVIREYVVSEAMHALNIPTTRALAAVTTGDMVQRETATPGAVLARVASSHIRVGTFQFHYARRDKAALQTLTDYVVKRHYPDADGPIGMLAQVIDSQANLVAKWMGVGFIHGVMNTDNMSIAGETIDYGPCAFMDNYHPETVFSSIDRHGRYAFANQPKIALWNLSQLAQTLVPLVGEAGIPMIETALNRFDDLFAAEFATVFGQKLGLLAPKPADAALVEDILNVMADSGVDFTLLFTHLTTSLQTGDASAARALFDDPRDFDVWLEAWRLRVDDWQKDTRIAAMALANPVYIPRNHRLETVINAANSGDYAPFKELIQVLAKPFDHRPEFDAYALPPKPEQVIHATFCGT